jgi:hypothetical protein
MRLRMMLTSAGVAAAVVAVVACVAVTVGGCGSDLEAGMEPATSGDEQNMVQAQLPPLDLNVPSDFQTAAFAYG